MRGNLVVRTAVLCYHKHISKLTDKEKEPACEGELERNDHGKDSSLFSGHRIPLRQTSVILRQEDRLRTGISRV